MSVVSSLRSVALGVPDLDAAERFFVESWGLERAERTASALYLRGTSDDHHILALHRCAEPEIRSITFRVPSAAALRSIAATAPEEGGRVLSGPGPADDPAGGETLTVRDPQGRILAFVCGDRRAPSRGPIRDRPVALTHVNLNASDVGAAQRFFERVLGFRLSDRSKLMAFMRCNSDHHSVVLADAGVDSLNHIAFLMPDLESVMRGSGRMIDHGYPIAWGVGRHGPGDNVFAYFVGPFGFVIEYTAEILQVDDSYVPHGPDHWVWPPGRADQWGISPLPSAALKEAQKAIRFAPVEA